MERQCPKCGTQVEIERWDSGYCPNCGLDYWWEDDYDFDYSYIVWDEW